MNKQRKYNLSPLKVRFAVTRRTLGKSRTPLGALYIPKFTHE